MLDTSEEVAWLGVAESADSDVEFDRFFFGKVHRGGLEFVDNRDGFEDFFFGRGVGSYHGNVGLVALVDLEDYTVEGFDFVVGVFEVLVGLFGQITDRFVHVLVMVDGPNNRRVGFGGDDLGVGVFFYLFV